MGGFLRTLAKVGLVELDEPEQAKAQPAPTAAPAGDVDMEALDRLLAEDPASIGTGGGGDDVDALIAAAGGGGGSSTELRPTMPSGVGTDSQASSAVTSGETGIVEGRPFADIYKEASVPDSPFPAEKMIKMLDGLRAMDPNTRRAAVVAMDAADDAWSVDDSVLDAQRKIQVLQRTTAALAETVSQAAAKAAADVQAQETYQAQATDSIRKQIADLEALLQEELQKVADEKAAIEAGLKGTREAFERETARFNEEIQRLQEISVVFGGAGTAGPTSG